MLSGRPLLKECHWLELFSAAIDRANAAHGYRLTAFVYMPEHVHLLVCALQGASGIEDLLRAIKRPYSYRIKRLLEKAGSPLLDALTVRQRAGVQTFRYCQEGPGYDRNLTTERAVRAAIDYIHMNPVRRELCQRATDWKWSIARWYASGTQSNEVGLPRVDGLPAEFFDRSAQ